MYKGILDKLIPKVIGQADEWSLKERANFNPFAEVIEEYVQSHGLIVGEQTGVDLILGRPFHKDSYPYILYSEDAEVDGFNIADQLYEKIGYKYVQAISQLDGAEVQVKVADRLMARIIQLEEYKGINLLSLTDPKTYVGWFNRNLLCISVDVQMARIYRQMSSPAYVDKWESLLRDEFELFEIIKAKNHTSGGREKLKPKRIQKLIRDELEDEDCGCAWIADFKDNEAVEGSAENISNYITDEPEEKIIEKPEEVAIENPDTSEDSEGSVSGGLDKQVIIDIVGNLKATFISQRYNKAQITNVDADELETTLKGQFGDKLIQRIIQLPKIPGDERLRRYTYYLIESERKQPIIDLFNIDRYDPIPIRDSYCHPLVILRMLIVDIWTLKLIKEIGQVDAKFAERRISELYVELLEVRDGISNGILTISDLDILKSGYEYVGIMDKDQYIKSKIIRSTRHRNEIYFPAAEKNK